MLRRETIEHFNLLMTEQFTGQLTAQQMIQALKALSLLKFSKIFRGNSA